MQDEGERLAELTLLGRLRSGDRAALGEVDRRHRAGLLAAMRRLGGDAALAEDAVQEALVALWTHPPEDRPSGSLRAWLTVAARHALTRRWHHDARPSASVEVLGIAAGWGDPALGARVESALASRQCLERGFARLSPEAREVLVLVDIEEVPLAESAAAVGVTLAALKSRLHRARLELIAALTREDCHES